MSFTELSFLFFVVPLTILISLVLSFVKSIKVRKVCVTLFSWGVLSYYCREALALFVLFIFVTYLMGNLIFAWKKNQGSVKRWIGFFVAVLISILFYVKYVPAILKWWNAFDLFQIAYFRLATLVGVSFIVFEAVSYIMDISRGHANPGSFWDYTLFISFFPKLVSGPIVLWKDFQPQLTDHAVQVNQISSGLSRVIIGYAKKVILADTLGANIAYIQQQSAMRADRVTFWLVAVMYFFEIYFDFSGYSDVTIGFSEMLGFRIKENFNYPYTSKSITEFWRRWHISLGTWFREYVYFPLGGNRSGNVYVNLFVVFLLTGIWHGANLTFLVWGVAHGLVVVVERAIREKNWYKKIPSILKWAFSMLFVFFAWILFMSPSIQAAGTFYKSMFISTSEWVNFRWRFFLTRKTLIILIISFLASIAGGFAWKKKFTEKIEKPSLVWFKYVMLLGLFALVVIFIVNSSYSPFIYMQF